MKERSTRAILIAAVALLALNLFQRQEAPALAQGAARPAGSGIATDANEFYVYVLAPASRYLTPPAESVAARDRSGAAVRSLGGRSGGRSLPAVLASLNRSSIGRSRRASHSANR